MTERSSKDRKQPPRIRASRVPSRALLGAGMLFLFALLLRVMFWRSTPDAGWPYSALYRGDTLVWLQSAAAIRRDVPFEAGLPMRPPGMAYLLAALWNGSLAGFAGLRFLWCALGAATVVLIQRTVSRSFGDAVGWVTGITAAASTALLTLSTSINNETPYLLLAIATIALTFELRQRPSLGRLAVWSILNALACLVRVEHLLFFLPALAWLAIGWRPRLRPVALAIGFFALTLAPWQVRIHGEIQRFNTIVRPNDAGLLESERRVEEQIRGITWDPGATRERERLPGFVRRLGGDFVASTVRHRGGDRVTAADFRILDEAFGYRPEPIGSWPFITSYGPLNFYLANNPHAQGGFNRLALDDPPPLEGGRDLFPPDLLLVPPESGTLFLDYPPHLHAFNAGVRLGMDWIRKNRSAALGLGARKLGIFAGGATLGLGSRGFPIGISGVQRAVDITVPRGTPGVIAWRLLILGLGLAGLVIARRRPELVPWLIFLASKLVITLMYFGYARIGATAAPVVLLLAALAVDRLILSRLPWNRLWIAVTVALLILIADGLRFASHPTLRIDGSTVTGVDPFPGDVHRDRTIVIQ
jgi:hypothetical protein